jgi:hypothetical protein
MTPGRKAAAVGFLAFAVILMVYSFYQSFYAGPRPAPPEAGKIMAARMQQMAAEYNAKHPRRAGTRNDHSAGASGAKPDSGSAIRH